ncbi:DUF4232 domain-containing protein [Nocardiopsis aegyptia]|uniref:DUF4232 domain-containing protein n=1 Tax=Nocardiopsis aegyptia TaxID=220378 RepID=A0A7Z0EM61_9ACTN|nr:DUF4232 domain-containing protein [Nocardiopsis aegyptia]NYJ33805.1 hypothetical protein [Nocardiopsis aegyptia]
MTRKTTTTARARTRIAVLTAAMVAAPAVGAATAAPAAAQESMSDCVVTDFSIAETDRRAAAGTAYIEFTMTRTGEGETPAGEPCNLYRYANLIWVDDQDEPVGAWAEREGGSGSYTVEPDGTVLLTVAQPNPANYDPELCEPTPVSGLAVSLYIAEQTVTVPTGGHDTACANAELAVPRYSIEPGGN